VSQGNKALKSDMYMVIHAVDCSLTGMTANINIG
jgi:hypothetical protein